MHDTLNNSLHFWLPSKEGYAIAGLELPQEEDLTQKELSANHRSQNDLTPSEYVQNTVILLSKWPH